MNVSSGQMEGEMPGYWAAYTAVIQFQKITTESSSDGVSGALKDWAALKIQADQVSDKQTPPKRAIEKRNEIFHNKLFSSVHQNIAS